MINLASSVQSVFPQGTGRGWGGRFCVLSAGKFLHTWVEVELEVEFPALCHLGICVKAERFSLLSYPPLWLPLPPFMVRRRKGLIKISRIIFRWSRQSTRRSKRLCYLKAAAKGRETEAGQFEEVKPVRLYIGRPVEQMWVAILPVHPEIHCIQWNLGAYFGKQALLSSKPGTYKR